jgi:hypothetical protein
MNSVAREKTVPPGPSSLAREHLMHVGRLLAVLLRQTMLAMPVVKG